MPRRQWCLQFYCLRQVNGVSTLQLLLIVTILVGASGLVLSEYVQRQFIQFM